MGRVGAHRRLPIEDTVSAGGVVWRRVPDGQMEIVVCGRKDGVWVLPKGTPDPGERIEDTAIREVEEETGLRVRLGESIGSITYWFTSGGIRFHKQVHHWLMEPVGGDVADHDHEFDFVEWISLQEGLQRLTYENERRVLERAAAKLKGE